LMRLPREILPRDRTLSTTAGDSEGGALPRRPAGPPFQGHVIQAGAMRLEDLSKPPRLLFVDAASAP